MPTKNAHSVAGTAEYSVRAVVTRQLFPLFLVLLALWLVRDHIPELNPEKIWLAFHQVALWQWSIAILCTVASFWAVGRYDQLVHGLFDSNVIDRAARASGVAAMAIAQFVGFGVLSSALVRWRLLPGLSLPGSLKVSLAVSMAFLGGWATVTSVAVVTIGAEFEMLQLPSQLFLLMLIVGCIVIFLKPVQFARVPGLRTIGIVTLLAFVDTFFAACALYVLLPTELGVAPGIFYVAFLVALGCGLIGGTPGGIGPFEIALLSLLPTLPQEPMLATILAFRIVYHIVPATLAFGLLVAGLKNTEAQIHNRLISPAKRPFLAPKLERSLWYSARAEHCLYRQGNAAILNSGNVELALVSPVGQCLVLLLDPLRGAEHARPALMALNRRARRLMRSAFLYKSSARTAVAARQMGWKTLAIGSEAVIAAKDRNLVGPQFRQLRRMLRKSAKCGVTIQEATGSLPLVEMQSISDKWEKAHGTERGFSMGRFDGDYAGCQRVFLAYHRQKLVAFVTFHENHHEWTLDLMRQCSAAPDGTMHALINGAIDAAAKLQCGRVSLAAVPVLSQSVITLMSRFGGPGRKCIRGGLRQFKQCFAPRWETLYVAAPSKLGLVIGLWAVFAAIRHPK